MQVTCYHLLLIMASRFLGEKDGKAKLHTRKGHDMTWSCDIHGEPIAFYCKEHGLPVCDRCAIKDHQKPCQLENIGDVILVLVGKLDDKRLKIEETKPHLQDLDSKIQTCSVDARNHLQSIDGAANATFESKMKSVKDKERDEICLINEDADEDILTINEKREKRIKSCNDEAERQQLIINKCRAKVLLETKEISEMVSKKIIDLQSKNQHAISTMNNVDAMITRIKQNDKTLVNEAPQVLASLDDNSLIVYQDVSDCLARIERGVQKVKFVEGEVGGKHYGRIDGYIGKWELAKSIRIASNVSKPRVRDLISDDEICMRDKRHDTTYVTNISTEHTEKVIEGGSDMYITSFASVDRNTIVCGKWRLDLTGNSVDRGITLYDRQWKVIRDIIIARNSSFDDTSVYVDVERDGMILAALYGQSNIYVINPADGKIENTITMQGKEVVGKVQALSSGDIVMKTDDNEFTVISRSGEEKAAIHCDDWYCPWCRVDKLTDTLYITYWDKERTIFAVDQVSCDGTIQARVILEYEPSDRCAYISPCLVIPTGNLVACDGDKLNVYKKRFIV